VQETTLIDTVEAFEATKERAINDTNLVLQLIRKNKVVLELSKMRKVHKKEMLKRNINQKAKRR
jgi:hypothetical protein